MPLSLRFTQSSFNAWKHLCQQADTEIGAYGWCEKNDPLFVTQLWVPKQVCTPGTVEREPDQGAMNLAAAGELGLHPGLCARVWLHTHPGNCPKPSATDENYWDKFTKGKADRDGPGIIQHGHVMGIMARDGSTYARIAFREDYYWHDLEIPVTVVSESDDPIRTWAKQEVADKVQKKVYPTTSLVQTPSPSSTLPFHGQTAGLYNTSSGHTPVAQKADRFSGMSKSERKRLKRMEREAVTFQTQALRPLTKTEWDRYHELDAKSNEGADLTIEEFHEFCELDMRAR